MFTVFTVWIYNISYHLIDMCNNHMRINLCMYHKYMMSKCSIYQTCSNLFCSVCFGFVIS